MRLSEVLVDDESGATSRDEAERVGLVINEAINSELAANLEQRRRRRTIGVIAGGLLGLLGIWLLLTTTAGTVAIVILLAGVVVGGGAVAYTEYDTPDVSVRRVDKGYWTGYRIPTEDGTFIYDATGSTPETEFELELIRDAEAIESFAEELSDPPEYPPVMADDSGVEDQLLATMDAVREELEAADRHTVELPVIRDTSRAMAALERVADEADTAAVETSRAVSAATARDDIVDLAELEEMAGDADNADLPRIRRAGERIRGDLTELQADAVTRLNEHINTAADAFGSISYHFYCPNCLQDDIESRLSPQAVRERTLYCETCRTNHHVDDAIPRHRIKDDLVNPIWDALWTEKDDQRRQIYENIEDQKAELKEREYEQRREEIRANADRLAELRSRIRDLETQARAAKASHEKMGELMTKYDRLNEQRKREFNRHIEETFETIEAQTEEVIEETRSEDQELLEEAMEEAEQKAELMREEQRRREAEKFMAEQELANQRMEALMEQQQAQHEELMEHHERTHREEWLRETRGGTSASTLINKAKMKKDRIVGYSGNGSGGGH